MIDKNDKQVEPPNVLELLKEITYLKIENAIIKNERDSLIIENDFFKNRMGNNYANLCTIL